MQLSAQVVAVAVAVAAATVAATEDVNQKAAGAAKAKVQVADVAEINFDRLDFNKLSYFYEPGVKTSGLLIF